ncbi:hypothetical protein IQ277_19695 [Nostocales cyanobacterium LEGE 12452]|nr:hypothetical protein [Nostocales cyanobacterium LEGE 12452]
MLDRGLQPWERLWKKAIENIYIVDWKPTHSATSMDLSPAPTLSPTLSKSPLQNLITNYELVLSVAEVLRIILTLSL